jgi:hypothetical protein
VGQGDTAATEGANQPQPPKAEVKNDWRSTSIPPRAFMAHTERAIPPTTRRHVPEDLESHQHRCESLKSRNFNLGLAA